MRYGLGMTLAEIASEMAICRSYVLRQEQLALKSLRRLVVGAPTGDHQEAKRETRRNTQLS